METSNKETSVPLRSPMDQRVWLSMLYDFYGELLKEHQKQIFEDYIQNDLSLSEIAEEQGISRQGVHDLVKRISRQLEEYEKKLHLIERFRLVREELNDLNKLAAEAETSGDHIMEQIKQLSEHILDLL